MPLIKIFDHVEQALAILASQFSNSTRIREMVRAISLQVQETEDAAFDLLSTTIEESVGDALDQWGEVVGEARGGLNDDQFRAIIRVRIRANRSNGNTEQIASILAELVGSPVFYELLYPAGYALSYQVDQHTAQACRDRWRDMMEDIRPAGVELEEIRENTPGAFGFEGNPNAEPFGIGRFTTELI